jgi:integrase
VGSVVEQPVGQVVGGGVPAQPGDCVGEAAGLRWCDVDLDGKTAVVSQQLQQYNGRLAVCPPKTPHSVRVIALDRTTIAGLAEHRHRQRAEAAAYGPGYRDSGYVFTRLHGVSLRCVPTSSS